MLIFKNLAADSVVLEKQSASVNVSSPSANRWVSQRWSGPYYNHSDFETFMCQKKSSIFTNSNKWVDENELSLSFNSLDSLNGGLLG